MMKVRLKKDEDRAYIAASMYKYLLARNDFKSISEVFNPYFDSLMESHIVKVVYDEEAPDVIMGYVVYKEIDETSVNVHFIYTRYSFRACGIATTLLDAVTSEYAKIFYFLSSPRIDSIMLETAEENSNPTRQKLINKAQRIKTPEMLMDFSSKETAKYRVSKNPT